MIKKSLASVSTVLVFVIATEVISLNSAKAQTPSGTSVSGGGNTVLGPQTAPPPVFVQTNSVTLTGTLVATTVVGTGFGTPTLPANFFTQSGSILRVTWHFVFAAGGSVTNSTVLIKLGSVTLATITLASPIGASGNVSCTIPSAIITARTVGASGTLITNGFHVYCLSGSTGNVAVSYQNANTTTSTVDTTVTELFDITAGLGNTAQSILTTNLVLAGY